MKELLLAVIVSLTAVVNSSLATSERAKTDENPATLPVFGSATLSGLDRDIFSLIVEEVSAEDQLALCSVSKFLKEHMVKIWWVKYGHPDGRRWNWISMLRVYGTKPSVPKIKTMAKMVCMLWPSVPDSFSATSLITFWDWIQEHIRKDYYLLHKRMVEHLGKVLDGKTVEQAMKYAFCLKDMPDFGDVRGAVFQVALRNFGAEEVLRVGREYNISLIYQYLVGMNVPDFPHEQFKKDLFGGGQVGEKLLTVVRWANFMSYSSLFQLSDEEQKTVQQLLGSTDEEQKIVLQLLWGLDIEA